MRAFVSGLGKVARAGGIAGAICLLAMALIVCSNTLFRFVFGRSLILATNELSSYLLLGIIFLGAAYAHLRGAHIRVDTYTSRLSPKMRLAFERYDAVISLLIMGVFCLGAWSLTREAYVYESVRQGALVIKVWWPLSVILLGLVLYFLFLITEIYYRFSRR